MPITRFQSEVLKLLAANRDPDSYLAGGIAINRSPTSKRFSKDIDIFHHAEESVLHSYTADEEVLRKSGYHIEIEKKEGSLIRATLSKGSNALKIEWVRDSAFRFFPVIEDDIFGYRLHDIDLATNKCLALASRNEIRDVIDLVQIDKDILSLGANVWASCAKDPGFSPGLMINQLARNSKIYPESLQSEELASEINTQKLKEQWLDMLDVARELIDALPFEDLGCIYLEQDLPVAHIDLSRIDSYQKHFGSVLGSWPKLV